MAGQQPVQRRPHRRHLLGRQRRLPVLGGVAGSQQQGVALPQRHPQALGQVQHQLPARCRPTRLNKLRWRAETPAWMPRSSWLSRRRRRQPRSSPPTSPAADTALMTGCYRRLVTRSLTCQVIAAGSVVWQGRVTRPTADQGATDVPSGNGRDHRPSFDTDTQVQALGDHTFAATISHRWRALGGTVNGGYLLAVCLQALRQTIPFPDPVVVSGFFLRPAAPGPAEIHTELARRGRRTATGEARLVQDGAGTVRAVATFTDLGQATARCCCWMRCPSCRRRVRRSTRWPAEPCPARP